MPWRESDAMDLRCRFVLLARERGSNVAELCREFDISRRTGYKWMCRYEEHGVSGLYDQSRRPLSCPHAISTELVLEIVRVKYLKPTWGAKKILPYLERRYPGTLPSRATIERVLERSGLVERRSKRPRRIPADHHLVKPEKPNDVWTVDFKGWWHTKDKTRCEPLTIRDEFSRYLIALKALNTTRQDPVKDCFRECFDRYGLPNYIRCDNGSPFVSSTSLCGLTQLSVWWLKVGVAPNRTRPATPSDNGAHERMHRDIKAELQKHAAKDIKTQQEVFDIWKEEFNKERPHEALKGKTPSDIYSRSKRHYDASEPEYAYPRSFEERKITSTGEFNWLQRKIFLTKALAGEFVGVDSVDPNHVQLWFTNYKLCTVEINQMKDRKRIYLK